MGHTVGTSYFWGHILHFEMYALLEHTFVGNLLENDYDQCNRNAMLMIAS